MPPKKDTKQHRSPFCALQRGLEALELGDRFCSDTGTDSGKTFEVKDNMCAQRKRKRSLEDDFETESSLNAREKGPEDVRTIPEALQCLKKLKTFVVREGHTDVLDNVLELENVLGEKCKRKLVRPRSKAVKQTTVTDFFRKKHLSQIAEMD
ncbi:PREDICTED: uncharacterized protein LOC109468052 [Branchiostoma belcheri]|uniref:Uncharacterized protein LOC109468052 n=1 Tax=Branchiostoma belcheri TaxID=7741 RepID=A0A6P4YX49_BRABE|nr:PREDICTED: uncharacterized protein LOC109468052 [Branchiostoma belcheri]